MCSTYSTVGRSIPTYSTVGRSMATYSTVGRSIPTYSSTVGRSMATYSMVGRSIADVYDSRLKAPKYIYCRDRIIEAIDQPTVLYLHSI